MYLSCNVRKRKEWEGAEVVGKEEGRWMERTIGEWTEVIRMRKISEPFGALIASLLLEFKSKLGHEC